MKTYSIRLKGSTIERIVFMLLFFFACMSVVLIPFALIGLLVSIEIVEEA